eukprot:366447-Chlamydomonas_euryale.AAC.4
MVLRSPWREWLMLCNPVQCATWQPGSAVDPGPGLVNGALCNECDLEEEDMKVIASGKASVKVKE